MAAALRALRRRAVASPDLLLPPSLPGPFPKLYAAAASNLLYAHGVHSSPTLSPSVLRGYCGGETAGGLASVHRGYASWPQVPSWMAVRHHGFTKGAAPSGVPALRRGSDLPLFVPCHAYSSKQLDALNHLEQEAWEYLVGQLPQMKKSVADIKSKVCIMIGMLGVSMYLFYLMVSELNSQVSALQEKVSEPESAPLDDDDDDDFFYFGGDGFDDDHDHDDVDNE